MSHASRAASLRTLAVLIGASAALAACATTPAARKAGLRGPLAETGEATAKAPPPIPDPDASLYGLFLAGDLALERGDSVDAARYLARASEIDADPYLKERAFTAAVIAGDIGKAAAIPLAPGEGSLAAQRLARLVRAVEALATNHAAQAFTLLKADPPEGQTAQAVVLLTPWAAAAAGDWTTALAVPAPSQGAPQLTNMFASFSRARLLERAGRMSDADAAYKALTANAENVTFVLGYGAFLERRGRRAEAVALYDRTLARNSDPQVVAARARAKAGRSAPPQLTLPEGAGESLLAPAATLIARRQPELGLAMMRLALRLDPKLDDAWISVGDAMAAAGDTEASRNAYSQVAPDSDVYAVAQSRLAWNLQREGQSAAALSLARAWLAKSGESPDAVSLYADLLRANDQFEAAIPYLDRLIDKPPPGFEPGRLYFIRGVAWERAGRWDKAEPDLEQALKLTPADPEVMNYLGFGWANRRQHLEQAFALLQKAVAARPRSGEIRDSLGWAEYRLGRYEDAVRDLEQAVVFAPAEPDINDHLGDAYWHVGRKLEAQYQWRRVLTLEPDEKLRAEIEAKLDKGLDGSVPVSPGASVASAAAPVAPQP